MFDTQEVRAPGLPADAAQPPAVPLPPSGQQVHLLDRLNAVFKHRRLAGTAFVLVLGGMMIQSYSTVPIYQTSARIEIQDERSTSISQIGINDPQFFQDPEPYFKTQHQILRSRELARRVVQRLDLQAHPDFNGSAPRPRDPLTLLRRARASLSAWVRELVSKPAAQTTAQAAGDAAAQENALIGAFLSGVEVREVPTTRLVDVLYTHTDAEFTALAANTLAEEYAVQNLEQRLASVSNQLTWLGDQLREAEAKVLASETALQQYREARNAHSLEERQNTVVANLTQLNEAVLRAQTGRLAAGAKYNQIRNADPTRDSADTFPIIGSDAGVVAAKNKLETALSRRTELAQRGYGENHPSMRGVVTDIANATRELEAERRRVIESVKNEYDRAALEEQNLARGLDAAKSDAVDLDRKSADYKILERQRDSNRQIYQSLLDQQKTLSVVANSRANNVKITDRAEVRRAPIAPNTRKDLITAILAGLALALGLAFGIEYLDDTVKTPEDVTRRLGLPLLGLVPAVRGDRVPLLTGAVPHDFGEAFRSLRTSLVFTSGSEATRIIAVTSTQPLEGKTTNACNLAAALALGGSRVLLIDADMRRPGLHKTMGLHNGLGLSHLLVGQSRVRDVIQRTREPNLFVITAGRTPPNPSELLSSDRMEQFIANLSHGPFDWVVIDTPPVLAVTDAVILTQRVASVVFVIGSEMTRRVHVERALETLRAGGARSIGAVLNRVDFDRNKYYYARYYGYQYKSYYGQNNVSA
jgi:capsular exopolysaccharide synthesis family protein